MPTRVITTYEIVTPTVTINVCGIAFDICSGNDAMTTYAMIDSEIEVCTRPGVRRMRNVIGRFPHMTPAVCFRCVTRGTERCLRTCCSLSPALQDDQKTLVQSLRDRPPLPRQCNAAVKTPVIKLPKLRLPSPFK